MIYIFPRKKKPARKWIPGEINVCFDGKNWWAPLVSLTKKGELYRASYRLGGASELSKTYRNSLAQVVLAEVIRECGPGVDQLTWRSWLSGDRLTVFIGLSLPEA
jgi:hypothetical protein